MKVIVLRPAIAMIELIFAIVIIGLVLMSAPQLISTATKSGYVTIQQESIDEAAAQVSMIIGYHWDENDTDEMYLDPIVNVDSTTAGLEMNSTTFRRPGTPIESYRSFIRSDGKYNLNATASLGIESGESEEDDMDDFHNSDTALTLEGSKAGNIDTNITIEIKVSYISDTATYNASTITYNFAPAPVTTGTTNIKMVEANLTTTSNANELDKTIILRAFSCNIGGFQLEERNF